MMYRKKYIALIVVIAVFFTACTTQSKNTLESKVKSEKQDGKISSCNIEKSCTYKKQNVVGKISKVESDEIGLLCVPSCFAEKELPKEYVGDRILANRAFVKKMKISDVELFLVFDFNVAFLWKNGSYQPHRTVGEANNLYVFKKCDTASKRLLAEIEVSPVNRKWDERLYLYNMKLYDYPTQKKLVNKVNLLEVENCKSGKWTIDEVNENNSGSTVMKLCDGAGGLIGVTLDDMMNFTCLSKQ